jgi:hypothetical protein
VDFFKKEEDAFILYDLLLYVNIDALIVGICQCLLHRVKEGLAKVDHIEYGCGKVDKLFFEIGSCGDRNPLKSISLALTIMVLARLCGVLRNISISRLAEPEIDDCDHLSPCGRIYSKHEIIKFQIHVQDAINIEEVIVRADKVPN